MTSSIDINELLATGELVIEPFDVTLVRPASVCLRLGDCCIFPIYSGPIDVRDCTTYPVYEESSISQHGGVSVPPKGLLLVNSFERIALGHSLTGWIGNLSGLARLGLQVVLSSFVSPGYGEKSPSSLTLEIFNCADVPIRIYPGMRICHLVIFKLNFPASLGYDEQVGTYSRQEGPRGSLFFEEFKE